MRKALLLGLALVLLLSGCGGGEETGITEVATAAPPATTAAVQTTVLPTTAAAEPAFATPEEAYYAKYCELAEQYGTAALYDIQDAQSSPYYHTGRSYLGGVCVVSQLDFDSDGGLDLFVVYCNGTLEWLENSKGSGLFPTRDSYSFEVWTYVDFGLELLLREQSVGQWGHTMPTSISSRWSSGTVCRCFSFTARMQLRGFSTRRARDANMSTSI